jgi:TatD DNase family protein
LIAATGCSGRGFAEAEVDDTVPEHVTALMAYRNFPFSPVTKIAWQCRPIGICPQCSLKYPFSNLSSFVDAGGWLLVDDRWPRCRMVAPKPETEYFCRMFTDTHTHLYSSKFEEDRSAMIQRAMDAGVARFFIPAIDSSYANRMYSLEAQYPENVFLMMGLHPVYVKPETFEAELDFVEKELARRKFYAVGEIGIDLYWDKSTLEIQKEAFRRQIGWAKKLGLPINIHCRDAFDPVFEVLESEQDDRLFGIFHCFTGNQQQANRAISLGMKLGIGGVVTYKNGLLDQFLANIPIESIVLETDAPYLAPVPYRGKRNESAYVVHVAQRLAEIYGLTVGEIARATTRNSIKVFGI